MEELSLTQISTTATCRNIANFENFNRIYKSTI